MDKPTLSHVRVFVRDFRVAVDFYTKKLGLPLAFEDGKRWAALDTGEAQLCVEGIEAGDVEGEALIGRFVPVTLRVRDIQATYREWSARGVRFGQAPKKEEWGGTLAFFDDPEGNRLCLMEYQP